MSTESSTEPGRSADVSGARGFLGVLRAAALIAVVTGAVGSVGLMLYAGHRNPSRLLLFLFALWVLSPFMVLVLANAVSKPWSVVRRVALHSVMLVLTLVTLAIYGDVALGPPRAKTAFVFVVVPPASWLLIGVMVAPAAFISGRLFQTRLARRIFKGFAVLVILAALGVGVLLGLPWLEHRTELTLPTPTGSFAIGRVVYDWADNKITGANAGGPRRLPMWTCCAARVAQFAR